VIFDCVTCDCDLSGLQPTTNKTNTYYPLPRRHMFLPLLSVFTLSPILDLQRSLGIAKFRHQRTSTGIEMFQPIPQRVFLGQLTSHCVVRKKTRNKNHQACQNSAAHNTMGRHVPFLAKDFPNSTPHWSKLLMPQTKPCTAVRCSYNANS
jgi:hypothetical protein